MSRRPPRSTLFPSRRSSDLLLARALGAREVSLWKDVPGLLTADPRIVPDARVVPQVHLREAAELAYYGAKVLHRSEEHTSELQSQSNLVCRLLLEKKKMHTIGLPSISPPCSTSGGASLIPPKPALTAASILRSVPSLSDVLAVTSLLHIRSTYSTA